MSRRRYPADAADKVLLADLSDLPVRLTVSEVTGFIIFWALIGSDVDALNGLVRRLGPSACRELAAFHAKLNIALCGVFEDGAGKLSAGMCVGHLAEVDQLRAAARERGAA